MWDDFDDDSSWDEEDDDGLDHEQKRIYGHPLMKKAQDIVRLTHALVGSLDEARKELYGGIMMEDATMMTSKFAGAESCEDYVQKMENAVIMKVHAKSLRSMSYQLAVESTHAEEHLQLLRDAIEDYRKLFVTWINGFDSSEKMDDGWGIFTG
ncbi:hypothetical protein [Algoriphagus machipongonensis]|uniref:Uncharacterized protein n=1 Tax=Algoriphagus machipongonensis TaxID=388413 RepID=A3HTW0_9BACT|nr:hypothetical protein [Algoriphagus machipongonensis]EAZ81582.1 hypothetical protein ALPR1_00035 [Algoriphagus machipongonensis]